MPMEQPSKPPPDDFPLELSSVFSGVSWTNMKQIIGFCRADSVLPSALLHNAKEVMDYYVEN